jgi:hypothetical protein
MLQHEFSADPLAMRDEGGRQGKGIPPELAVLGGFLFVPKTV